MKKRSIDIKATVFPHQNGLTRFLHLALHQVLSVWARWGCIFLILCRIYVNCENLMMIDRAKQKWSLHPVSFTGHHSRLKGWGNNETDTRRFPLWFPDIWQSSEYHLKHAWHSMVNTSVYASSWCHHLLVILLPCQAIPLRNDALNGLPICLSWCLLKKGMSDSIVCQQYCSSHTHSHRRHDISPQTLRLIFREDGGTGITKMLWFSSVFFLSGRKFAQILNSGIKISLWVGDVTQGRRHRKKSQVWQPYRKESRGKGRCPL